MLSQFGKRRRRRKAREKKHKRRKTKDTKKHDIEAIIHLGVQEQVEGEEREYHEPLLINATNLC